MPATLTLEENGRVLHYVLEDPVNIAEIRVVEKQANAYYASAQCALHTLMDLGKVRSLPNGIFQFRGTKGLSHPHAGETVVLVASTYVRKIGETFVTLSRNKHIHFFSPQDSDNAWEFLRQTIANENAAFPENAPEETLRPLANA